MGKRVTNYERKSNNRITLRLDDEDLKLFEMAMEEYNLKEGKLANKIISSWLFNNKLQLRGKNG